MKLIVLDRDGVINHDSADFIKTPEEWIALPGSLEAIARLNQQNWRVIVASNQSGLARGLFDMYALNEIHAKFKRELAEVGGQVDAIFICPHGPDDGCTCRKPLPGMLHDIARRYDTPLHQVPAVGDSLRDLQAAATAGCSPWLVQTGNGDALLASGQALPEGTRLARDLAAVADALLTKD